MITLVIEKANNLFNDLMIRGYNYNTNIDYSLTYYNCLTVNETIEEFKKLNNINDDNIKNYIVESIDHHEEEQARQEALRKEFYNV